MTKSLPFLIIFLSPLILCAQPFSFEKNDEGAWVMDNGEKVLFYQAKTKSLKGKAPRGNYVHPLYGINGHVLTEDFPADHLHHRGIFWAWHQVWIGEKKIGDSWECRDFVWDVERFDEESSDENSVSLNAYVLWKSPEWLDEGGEMKPFMKERTVITVHKQTDNFRAIDFEISLLAMEDGMQIGGSEDLKGYGGFSVRMKLPPDVQFHSISGEVEPKVTQVQGTSWMNISGSLNEKGKKEGVVIISHPDNWYFPEKWILRKKGSMQNPVYPGRHPHNVSKLNPTVIKYRVVVYSNELADNIIKSITDDFRISQR